MFEKLSHIMLYVNDMNRALAWYTGVLGCAVNFSHAPHYASLRLDSAGLRLDLHGTEAGSRDVGFGPIPYFQVRDIETVLAALAAKGVKVSQARREGDSPRFATFWDSEGNALGLQEAR
ncbi:MAG: VOC family protein [Planctomycetes bacterium]|jgi:predicted enzyme related to lactoylglutathione lyase|nr:VOC family protein [Planctomycetota bacterium]MCL4730616.1 VOC family protein [Planctomycetota bacterium]